MDHLHAELHGQAIEGLVFDELADLLGVAAGDFLVVQVPLGKVDQALLRPVRDQPGIGAVLQDGGGAGLAPAGRHAADVHVPPIERPLGGMLVGRAGVRVPNLHRRVQIEHPSIVTPLDDLAAVDVPGQIDQEIAGRHVFPQFGAQILRRDLPPDETDALADPRLQRVRTVLEIHDRDVLKRDAEVFQEDRQRTLGHGPVAQEQNAFVEVDHAILPMSQPSSSPIPPTLLQLLPNTRSVSRS